MPVEPLKKDGHHPCDTAEAHVVPVIHPTPAQCRWIQHRLLIRQLVKGFGRLLTEMTPARVPLRLGSVARFPRTRHRH